MKDDKSLFDFNCLLCIAFYSRRLILYIVSYFLNFYTMFHIVVVSSIKLDFWIFAAKIIAKIQGCLCIQHCKFNFCLKYKEPNFSHLLITVTFSHFNMCSNCVGSVIHYLKNKVGVVDFANAQGLVMF